MKVRDKRTYEIPLMTVSLVELEGKLCVTSGQEATIQQDGSKVKVVEYTTIENDVVFE